MKKALTIKKLKPMDAQKLRIHWSNGIAVTLELAELIVRNRALAPLNDAGVFRKARVGDWGHSVHWTDEVELGADALWRRTLQALGREDAARFLEWRTRHGLSLSQAAQELGISRRMVAYYESGKHEVPRTVLLACTGWEAQKRQAA